MAFYLPPEPGIQSLISDFVRWIAQTLHAKVTITVWKSDKDNYTESCDASIPRKS